MRGGHRVAVADPGGRRDRGDARGRFPDALEERTPCPTSVMTTRFDEPSDISVTRFVVELRESSHDVEHGEAVRILLRRPRGGNEPRGPRPARRTSSTAPEAVPALETYCRPAACLCL